MDEHFFFLYANILQMHHLLMRNSFLNEHYTIILTQSSYPIMKMLLLFMTFIHPSNSVYRRLVNIWQRYKENVES